MANNTVTTKVTGDTLTAAEINDIATRANSKQEPLGFTPENTANKGLANGYPSLDSVGKIPIEQLPAESGYIDKTLPVSIADTNSIPFTNMLTVIADHQMSSSLVITPNILGSIAGAGAIQRIISDATNIPDISAFKTLSSSLNYNNLIGAVNIYIFFFDGVSYNVAITQNTEIILPNANLEVSDWVTRLATAGYNISATRKAAYQTFWDMLKVNGMYNLITEAWMFEGGSAATNILSFKGISDGIIHGSITHSPTGSKGDGATGRMGLGISIDAGGSATSIGTYQSVHIAAYLRLNEAGGSGAGHDAVGARGLPGTETVLTINPQSSGFPSYFQAGGYGFNHNTPDTNGRFILNRNPTDGVSLTKDGINIGNTSPTTSGGANNTELSAFASVDGEGIDSFSPQEIGFISVGKGLTPAQITTLDIALSNLNAALSR